MNKRNAEKITIDKTISIPFHVQLLSQLRQLILSGQLDPGSRLPSEAELQSRLEISRSTIRQALNNAKAEGLIERVTGKGSFVTSSPNAKAKLDLIGYITFGFRSDMQVKLLSGAESVTKARGYGILFCHSNRDIKEENRLLDQLIKDKIRGILIWPAMEEDKSRRIFQLAAKSLIPLVLIDRTLKGLEYDYVISENYAGAYTATEFLVKLGHKRISFLSQPILRLITVAERLRGYRQAVKDAGLKPLDPVLVGTPNLELMAEDIIPTLSASSSKEIEQIARYLAEPDRPTAIFAMNDLVAMQALKAANLAGLRVPDHLSIVGFDDMDIVAHLEVPLTTVSQDTSYMGRRAAELLFERVEGYNGPPRREVIPTHLQIRASTKSPFSPQSV